MADRDDDLAIEVDARWKEAFQRVCDERDALQAEVWRLHVGIRKAAQDVDGWNDGVRDDLLALYEGGLRWLTG
jgi:hypothetical protein